MFDIASNQIIKITKGDSSGPWKLSINEGTLLRPIKYKFYSSFGVDSPKHLLVEIDRQLLKSRLDAESIYVIEYNYLYSQTGRKIGGAG